MLWSNRLLGLPEKAEAKRELFTATCPLLNTDMPFTCLTGIKFCYCSEEGALGTGIRWQGLVMLSVLILARLWLGLSPSMLSHANCTRLLYNTICSWFSIVKPRKQNSNLHDAKQLWALISVLVGSALCKPSGIFVSATQIHLSILSLPRSLHSLPSVNSWIVISTQAFIIPPFVRHKGLDWTSIHPPTPPTLHLRRPERVLRLGSILCHSRPSPFSPLSSQRNRKHLYHTSPSGICISRRGTTAAARQRVPSDKGRNRFLSSHAPHWRALI